MAERRGPWTVLDSRPIYGNPWISVVEHRVLTPRGAPGIYGVVSPRSIATGVVPIDADGFTVLVGQHRFPLDRFSWEIPEGGGDPAVAPIDSAARELLEETGLRAASWLEILQLDLSNSITDEVAHAFLAWDLTQDHPAPDETEELELRRLPFREAVAMAWRGEIRDAIAVAALFKIELMAVRGELPAPVAAALAGPAEPARRP